VFPCFDQPDLKAKWTLTAVIPSVWDAVSNEFVDTTATSRSEKAIDEVKEVAALFS
jgi:aminopeptidase N